jgi:hypothetical protein
MKKMSRKPPMYWGEKHRSNGRREKFKISETEVFELEMFLIHHSFEEAPIAEGMWLQCKCGREKCFDWSTDLIHFGKCFRIPNCLNREFMKKFKNFVSWKYRDKL